jgi:eukaryotic-like serine/threonine-protein kinase
VDADVLQLVREERLLEAALLCSQRGDAADASALFERACDWRAAATEALRADDPLRALELALRAGDDAIAHAAATRIAVDPRQAERAAAHLTQHGRHAWAARVLEASLRDLDAAFAWERAGDLIRAAALFERAGEPARAARALEACLRRDPEAASAAVALGALLLRFGRDQAGVRALQRVPARAPERRAALTHLVGAFRRVGLSSAAADAEAELAALGGPLAISDATVPGQALLYGRYDVLEQVASSARARVLQAVDRARGELVALKVYASSEGRAPTRTAFLRLESDVRALQPLYHPAIVPVPDLFPSGCTVVLRWMEGGTLEQMMARGPIAPARAAEIGAAILSALGDAHRLGILHRDVKSTNVLFDATGAARLSDFGAAHVADASATVTAGDLGALATLSPEQREGREVTTQSDLFAVGVLLEEMLTQAKPGAVALRSLPSEAHGGLDARHDEVVRRMTARDPGSRPADAFQARDLLLSLPWPGPAGPADAPGRSAERRSSDRPASDRLTRRADGTLVDAWTDRAIECVALTDETLERARVFARADHEALQAVLRIDREAGFLWLASCGAPLDRPLTSAERERLQGALDALQSAGAPSAQLDEARAAVGPSGEIVLRFEASP